jgi:hypothetical protein
MLNEGMWNVGKCAVVVTTVIFLAMACRRRPGSILECVYYYFFSGATRFATGMQFCPLKRNVFRGI